jgi:hypothetical protein
MFAALQMAYDHLGTFQFSERRELQGAGRFFGAVFIASNTVMQSPVKVIACVQSVPVL